MKKKAKIITTLGSLCIAIAMLIVGVLAASTAGFDVSSSVSFTSTGVFVKVQGDILKGATASSATKATAPQGADYDYVGYSYNHADGSDEPNGTTLNPDQPTYALPEWNVGTVSFDEVNQTIVYSFKFSNYSAFQVSATITTNLDEFRTAYGDKLTITETGITDGIVSIAQDATNVEYSIALKLNNFSTSLSKTLTISMSFAKDEPTPANYIAPASLDGFGKAVSGNTTTYTNTFGDTYIIEKSGTTETHTYTRIVDIDGTPTQVVSSFTTDVSSTKTLTNITYNIDVKKVIIPDYLEIIAVEGSFYMGQFTPIIASNTVEEVVLPEGLISIKSYSFARMRSLKSVFIPASVTSIEVDAFYDSPLLNAIFEDPVGWSVTSLKWDPEVLSSTDLADPERAAGYLCSEYYSYSWIKS